MEEATSQQEAILQKKGHGGRPCGSPTCNKVQGNLDENGDFIRLNIRCKNCLMEYYCSRTCREEAKDYHKAKCLQNQEEKRERRGKKMKQVACDTCKKRQPYTKMKKCSRCRSVTYCSEECQKQDWSRHKKDCHKLR
eukprot:scaffold25826_cov132-Cylindrotheca_fusiformis.AAC.4